MEVLEAATQCNTCSFVCLTCIIDAANKSRREGILLFSINGIRIATQCWFELTKQDKVSVLQLFLVGVPNYDGNRFLVCAFDIYNYW